MPPSAPNQPDWGLIRCVKIGVCAMTGFDTSTLPYLGRPRTLLS